jgi:hypothetical protein
MFEQSSAEQYDELIRCSPSEASFLLLLRADTQALSPDAAMAVGVGAERAKRTLDAIGLKALARAACRPRDPAVPDEVASEFSAATGMHPSTASHRVELARSVVARLPGAVKALDAAELTQRQLEALDRATAGLPDEQAVEVAAACIPGGSSGFARRLAAALVRIAPDHAKKKAEENRSRRTVDNWSDPAEGVAGFGLQGPLDLAALIKAAIDQTAKKREPGECRTIGTRRFDVVLGWARRALGLEPTADEGSSGTSGHADESCDSCGRAGSSTLPINVTVPLTTLLRLSDQPGELDGMPIPAEAARELAADGRWRRWIVEPVSGALLDIGSTTYRPRAALDRFVRGRDRTCRFPSCTQPSVRCDLDHTFAFHTEDGQTVRGNLVPLCRHHHRLKHETDWSYAVRGNGDVVWTAPSGRQYVDRADDHYDDPVISRVFSRAHARRRARTGESSLSTRRRVPKSSGDPWITPSAQDDEEPFPF